MNPLQVATVKKEPVTPQSCLFTGQPRQKWFAELFLLHVFRSILEAWTVICLMKSACLLVCCFGFLLCCSLHLFTSFPYCVSSALCAGNIAPSCFLH